MAESFDHRGVVRKAVVVGLAVGSLQKLDVEALRRLYQTVFITRNGDRGGITYFSHRLYHRDDGNDSFCGTCRLVAVANDLDRRERPYTIVYTYYTFCIVRNQCQSMLYAVEARLTTIGQLVVNGEVVFFTELSPVVLLCLG